MNLRWLVVESSVGLSHQVGAVVEQVFAVDPLAVAHVVALVGDEVLGFAVIHAEGREVVHNPLFDAVIVDVIGFGRRACGEGVLIVVVEVREHARVEGAFAWFEASRKGTTKLTSDSCWRISQGPTCFGVNLRLGRPLALSLIHI